jgi:chorismate mutase/prephenate dehydratase
MSKRDEISRLRAHIDEIDDQLLTLLNERAQCAVEIGGEKNARPAEVVYRPEREAQILQRLGSSTDGPLPQTEITNIFREIISACRSVENRPRVLVLGPAGTYSEAAALKHFGQAVQIIFNSGIEDVFHSLESEAGSYGVVPVENSTEGGIATTLDCLVVTSLRICGEIDLRIRHALIGQHSEVPHQPTTVKAHPQALAQCRNWLDQNLRDVERIAVNSNAAAVEDVAKDPNCVAIASADAADHYGLMTLHNNIEDYAGNTTRFLILGHQETTPSENDKTSLVLSGKGRDAPGSLQRLLAPLADHKINMTRIESRPSRTGLWEYVFFLDIEGHQDEPLVTQALAAIEQESALFKVLGSYPRAL